MVGLERAGYGIPRAESEPANMAPPVRNWSGVCERPPRDCRIYHPRRGRKPILR